MKKIEITADKVLISGPRVDGTWKVTFEVGEYLKDKVAEILALPSDENLKVTVELLND